MDIVWNNDSSFLTRTSNTFFHYLGHPSTVLVFAVCTGHENFSKIILLLFKIKRRKGIFFFLLKKKEEEEEERYEKPTLVRMLIG